MPRRTAARSDRRVRRSARGPPPGVDRGGAASEAVLAGALHRALGDPVAGVREAAHAALVELNRRRGFRRGGRGRWRQWPSPSGEGGSHAGSPKRPRGKEAPCRRGRRKETSRRRGRRKKRRIEMPKTAESKLHLADQLLQRFARNGTLGNKAVATSSRSAIERS